MHIKKPFALAISCLTVVLALNVANAQTSGERPPYFSSIRLSPATITLGQSATISWETVDATACSASGTWSGSEPTTGSQSLIPTSTGNLPYLLSCIGPGGETTNSETLTVDFVPMVPASNPVGPSSQGAVNENSSASMGALQQEINQLSALLSQLLQRAASLGIKVNL